MSKTKEINCSRCGDIMDPNWCSDDHAERDVCEDCQNIIDAEEEYKEKRD